MKTRMILVILAVAMLSCVAAYAHHSFAATYDQNKTVTIEGKVAQFLIRSPHSFLHVLAKDESGQMQRWAVSASPPPSSSGRLEVSWLPAREVNTPDDVVECGRPPRESGVLGHCAAPVPLAIQRFFAR